MTCAPVGTSAGLAARAGRSRGRDAGRRQALLDAADRVVMRDGPEASMSAIAAEAGVTKPILYRHFTDKGGLYQALAERHTEELLATLRAALVAPGSPRERTAATVDAYLAAIEDRPQLYRFLMHRGAAEDPAVHGTVAVFVRRLGDELATVMGGGDPSPAERQQALTWAHGVVGMVQGVGDWWLETRGMPRAKLVEHLVDMLWGGFARATEARRR